MRVLRVLLALAVLGAASACAANDEASFAGGHESFAASTRTHAMTGSRSVLDVATLRRLGGKESPVLIEGSVVDVREDRAWVNLQESEIRDGIDTREVPFQSPEAAFRTILVTLDVGSVLRAGGMVASNSRRDQIDRGGRVDLTLILHNDTSFDAAASELRALGTVIVAVAETDRGSFGRVLEPYGGSDLVIAVSDGGALQMPLTDRATADFVLGSLRTRDELAAAVRS